VNKFFDLDSPVMRFLSVMADVFWINLLTVICSIPIFTIGASFTAMHYVLLKLVRNEEGYITKSYFKAFRDNFRQATGMWLIFLLVFAVLAFDYYAEFYMKAKFPAAIVIAVYAATVIIWCICLWAFPLLSHFVNTVRGTLRNALIMTIAALPRTLGMLGLSIVPFLLLYFGGNSIIPIVLLFFVAGPAYGCAALYSPAFKKMEPEEKPESHEEDSLDFTDEDDAVIEDLKKDIREMKGEPEPGTETQPAAEIGTGTEAEEGTGTEAGTENATGAGSGEAR
jgi:uncharacterized membrane protein YesL